MSVTVTTPVSFCQYCHAGRQTADKKGPTDCHCDCPVPIVSGITTLSYDINEITITTYNIYLFEAVNLATASSPADSGNLFLRGGLID